MLLNSGMQAACAKEAVRYASRIAKHQVGKIPIAAVEYEQRQIQGAAR
jgi:hypothetical protein